MEKNQQAVKQRNRAVIFAGLFMALVLILMSAALYLRKNKINIEIKQTPAAMWGTIVSNGVIVAARASSSSEPVVVVKTENGKVVIVPVYASYKAARCYKLVCGEKVKILIPYPESHNTWGQLQKPEA